MESRGAAKRKGEREIGRYSRARILDDSGCGSGRQGDGTGATFYLILSWILLLVRYVLVIIEGKFEGFSIPLCIDVSVPLFGVCRDNVWRERTILSCGVLADAWLRSCSALCGVTSDLRHDLFRIVNALSCPERSRFCHS